MITSAGLVFGALVTLPLTQMVEMGFAVAFGVLLDAPNVRSLLVPALAYHLGGPVWWPGSLQSVRPRDTPRVPETIA